jgi:hypothetical protein
MRIQPISTTLVFVALGFFACPILYAQDEGVSLDPTTGNYVITYQGLNLESGTSSWQRVIFVPATKILPSVVSKVRQLDQNTILYSYAVRNNIKSQQTLSAFGITVSQIDTNTLSSPAGWEGQISQNYDNIGVRANWRYPRHAAEDGLDRGQRESGFGFESADLPGIDQMRFRGAAPTLVFPDEGPKKEIADQLDVLTDPVKNSVYQIAAVPRISVPAPYDAAVVLTNIQKHLDTDLVSLKLVDPALVAQMDPWFATAIDAAKRNNAEGLRNALQALRRLLKQECADVDQEGNEAENDDKPVPPARIAKLAARVLNFDLKYVGSRI